MLKHLESIGSCIYGFGLGPPGLQEQEADTRAHREQNLIKQQTVESEEWHLHNHHRSKAGKNQSHYEAPCFCTANAAELCSVINMYAASVFARPVGRVSPLVWER